MAELDREPYIYEVDDQDRMVRLSGNWTAFARENRAEECCRPENVIGRPIWDFIADMETRHLYELVFRRVRSAFKPIRFAFRCDAPDRQRFCLLAILPLPERGLEIFSQVQRTVARPRVPLLDASSPRSSEMIRLCSVCKRAALPDNRWVEVEEAIQALDLFSRSRLPQITHGTCSDCFGKILGEIEKL